MVGVDVSLRPWAWAVAANGRWVCGALQDGRDPARSLREALAAARVPDRAVALAIPMRAVAWDTIPGLRLRSRQARKAAALAAATRLRVLPREAVVSVDEVRGGVMYACAERAAIGALMAPWLAAGFAVPVVEPAAVSLLRGVGSDRPVVIVRVGDGEVEIVAGSRDRLLFARSVPVAWAPAQANAVRLEVDATIDAARKEGEAVEQVLLCGRGDLGPLLAAFGDGAGVVALSPDSRMPEIVPWAVAAASAALWKAASPRGSHGGGRCARPGVAWQDRSRGRPPPPRRWGANLVTKLYLPVLADPDAERASRMMGTSAREEVAWSRGWGAAGIRRGEHRRAIPVPLAAPEAFRGGAGAQEALVRFAGLPPAWLWCPPYFRRPEYRGRVPVGPITTADLAVYHHLWSVCRGSRLLPPRPPAPAPADSPAPARGDSLVPAARTQADPAAPARADDVRRLNQIMEAVALRARRDRDAAVRVVRRHGRPVEVRVRPDVMLELCRGAGGMHELARRWSALRWVRRVRPTFVVSRRALDRLEPGLLAMLGDARGPASPTGSSSERERVPQGPDRE